MSQSRREEAVESTTRALKASGIPEGNDVCEAVSDLLTNIMHYCASNGQEFGEVVTSATDNFEHESQGED